MLLLAPVAPVAPPDPQTLSSWDRLWPLLVTAGLSLAVVLIVQLYVVPHVESRKRREERWESDLRRLGECAAFDLTEAASEYFSALLSSVWLADRADDPDVDPSRHHEATRVADERRRAAHERFRKAETQADWLADRVCSVASGHPQMRRLQLAVMGVQVKDLSGVDPTYRSGEAGPSQEQVDEANTSLREAIRGLLKVVEELAAGKMPRKSTRLSRARGRLVRRVRAVRRGLGRGDN